MARRNDMRRRYYSVILPIYAQSSAGRRDGNRKDAFRRAGWPPLGGSVRSTTFILAQFASRATSSATMGINPGTFRRACPNSNPGIRGAKTN